MTATTKINEFKDLAYNLLFSLSQQMLYKNLCSKKGKVFFYG